MLTKEQLRDKKYYKKWRENPNNVSKLNESVREHYRKYLLEVIRDGKEITLKGNKRPYPKDNKCELCGRVQNYLSYHHWDDNDISKGIYVCKWLCHGFVEIVDRFHNLLFKKYLQFKRSLC